MPHPDYLLQMLTSSQLRDWELYALAEPFGQPRADLMAGVVAAATANVWLSTANSVHPLEMIGKEKPEATDEEIASGVKNFIRGMKT